MKLELADLSGLPLDTDFELVHDRMAPVADPIAGPDVAAVQVALAQ